MSPAIACSGRHVGGRPEHGCPPASSPASRPRGASRSRSRGSWAPRAPRASCPMKMFSGLRSRWTMACWWAASSASMTGSTIGRSSSGGSFPRSFRRCARSSPSRELEHEVGLAGRLLDAHVEGVDHVRVIEGGRRLRLLEEAAQHILVARELRQEQLHRDAAPGVAMGRGEHGAHAALADHARDLVAIPEDRSDPLLRGEDGHPRADVTARERSASPRLSPRGGAARRSA